ncbi:hypothetical protein ABB37_01028 [Leptomonas pyrrhocoris]|uniref:Uncharacterized protein n=1 Tax=Leptomonas pyrrhocoris TaxID=157538 RepID=A0A0N0DYS8_LEPPY|nr:hypothetical protein ABB37_01028 [Leptomonas pyrrhocoris]KPA84472.1 hypothetical protein ABB37_01028 [Leptomonas pyrrhocoris]|eukprot:XP_015662911.1 hypothetical protein ABB37_01028 [Leptomonas pyrrhocoris]
MMANDLRLVTVFQRKLIPNNETIQEVAVGMVQPSADPVIKKSSYADILKTKSDKKVPMKQIVSNERTLPLPEDLANQSLLGDIRREVGKYYGTDVYEMYVSLDKIYNKLLKLGVSPSWENIKAVRENKAALNRLVHDEELKYYEKASQRAPTLAVEIPAEVVVPRPENSFKRWARRAGLPEIPADKLFLAEHPGILIKCRIIRVVKRALWILDHTRENPRRIYRTYLEKYLSWVSAWDSHYFDHFKGNHIPHIPIRYVNAIVEKGPLKKIWFGSATALRIFELVTLEDRWDKNCMLLVFAYHTDVSIQARAISVLSSITHYMARSIMWATKKRSDLPILRISDSVSLSAYYDVDVIRGRMSDCFDRILIGQNVLPVYFATRFKNNDHAAWLSALLKQVKISTKVQGSAVNYLPKSYRRSLGIDVFCYYTGVRRENLFKHRFRCDRELLSRFLEAGDVHPNPGPALRLSIMRRRLRGLFRRRQSPNLESADEENTMRPLANPEVYYANLSWRNRMLTYDDEGLCLDIDPMFVVGNRVEGSLSSDLTGACTSVYRSFASHVVTVFGDISSEREGSIWIERTFLPEVLFCPSSRSSVDGPMETTSVSEVRETSEIIELGADGDLNQEFDVSLPSCDMPDDPPKEPFLAGFLKPRFVSDPMHIEEIYIRKFNAQGCHVFRDPDFVQRINSTYKPMKLGFWRSWRCLRDITWRGWFNNHFFDLFLEDRDPLMNVKLNKLTAAQLARRIKEHPDDQQVSIALCRILKRTEVVTHFYVVSTARHLGNVRCKLARYGVNKHHMVCSMDILYDEVVPLMLARSAVDTFRGHDFRANVNRVMSVQGSWREMLGEDDDFSYQHRNRALTLAYTLARLNQATTSEMGNW